MKRFWSILLSIVLCATMMIAGMLSGYAEEPESGSNSDTPSSSNSQEKTNEEPSGKHPSRVADKEGEHP